MIFSGMILFYVGLLKPLKEGGGLLLPVTKQLPRD